MFGTHTMKVLVLCSVCFLACLAQAASPNIAADPLSQTRPSKNSDFDSWLCSSNDGSHHTHHRVHGWVDGRNSRGTLDIIWTSVFTIFVATYTILCLNVPTRDEAWWSITGRRVLWMGVSIAGPEFVLAAAAGQWAAAKRSVADFRDAGYPQWTMRHAFFADMGGIELNARASTPFRVNAKHLHWLVTNRHVDFPEIALEEIWDKSKQDTIAKLITSIQICYVIVQSIARAVQHLAITTLELFALAIVLCSIAISWCWLHKPVDVKLPIKLHMDESIEHLLISAGPAAARPYRQTPMDFVDDLKPSWSLNIQTFIHMPIGPFERPISRLGNDRFPWLELPQSTVLSLATMVYAAIHMLAWNWHFPSRTEAICWRISSMILLASTGVFWVVETVAVWSRWNGGERMFYRLRGKLDSFAELEKTRSEDAAQAEPRQLPLKSEFWIMFSLALIYGAARSYLLVEAFWGLRSLEASAFVTVNWADFLPHV